MLALLPGAPPDPSMSPRVFACVASILLCSCALWLPGEDPKGAELKTRATPVLIALNRFHQEIRTLPGSLSELAPRYIQMLPAELLLRLDTKNELLIFTYSPTWPQAGKISCSAHIGLQEWNCGTYI
jgi:hypothetical protein